jgi:hypothetical protein
MTFATYVWKILSTHSQPPVGRLKDPEVVHTGRGTNVQLSIAEGWPLAVLSPTDAERLARRPRGPGPAFVRVPFSSSLHPSSSPPVGDGIVNAGMDSSVPERFQLCHFESPCCVELASGVSVTKTGDDDRRQGAAVQVRRAGTRYLDREGAVRRSLAPGGGVPGW